MSYRIKIIPNNKYDLPYYIGSSKGTDESHTYLFEMAWTFISKDQAQKVAEDWLEKNDKHAMKFELIDVEKMNIENAYVIRMSLANGEVHTLRVFEDKDEAYAYNEVLKSRSEGSRTEFTVVDVPFIKKGHEPDLLRKDTK